jgi:UDP-glucose 4-epimerase
MEKKKKTLLILGGYGFLGTNIIKHIDEYFQSDYEVIVFDKMNVHSHNVSANCAVKVYSGDFSDCVLLESIIKNNKIDKVIHCISTTVPSLSYNARYDIETNLISTINLLDILVKYGILDITFISSGGAVYGNSDMGKKHVETDNLSPLSSYGIIKLTIEKYLFQYAALYKLRPLVLRLSNPYGKYHYSEKQGICNIALKTALENKVFHVWGDGLAQKDYIFVDDFCNILFKLYTKNAHSTILNVGSGCVYSIKQILETIRQLKPDFTWDYTVASVYDVLHFELDCSKLLAIIGNYEFVDLKEGLKLVERWQQQVK